MLPKDGDCRSAGEIAEAEGVTRSFVNRMMRLTLLAPDIVEAILEGRHPENAVEGVDTDAEGVGGAACKCWSTASRIRRR